LRQKRKENYLIIIPEAIEQELVDEPRKLAERIKETAPDLAKEYSILQEELLLLLSKDSFKLKQ